MERRKRGEPAVPSRRAIRLIALLCALMLAAGVIPLYAISFYNHPYYDDFNFSAAVHDTWVSTGSLSQALTTAFESTQTVRDTWQGTYTGTFLSNLQPGVFSESLYWLTTFLLLTVFLACFGFLFHTLLRTVLGAGLAETVCVSSLALFLMTQFLPGADEAFYWFNGGVGNTFVYSLLALSAALSIRLYRRRRGGAGLILALFCAVTLLGGGSYGGGLFWLLLTAAFCGFAFVSKNRYRFVFLGLTAWFIVCFAYSMLAPGNGVRAAMLGTRVSPVKAVLQAVYYGVALMGSYFTLPVAAAALGLSPLLYRVAENSRFSFRHPLLVSLFAAGLFCAQLTPTLYAGVFLGGNRITDAVYFSFITLLLACETYALGALARRRAKAGRTSRRSAAARRGILLFSACVFAVGCLGFKPADETLYGPMNMAGGSAAVSILTGEAARYDREMAAREALLNDADQPTVTLSPLTAVPDVFMDDLLSPDAEYDVLPTLIRYYHKDDILLEGGGA